MLNADINASHDEASSNEFTIEEPLPTYEINGTQYTNLSPEPIQKALNWFPHDLVADAMMVGYAEAFVRLSHWSDDADPLRHAEIWHGLNHSSPDEIDDVSVGLYNTYVSQLTPEERLENRLANVTRGQCVVNSNRALNWLIEQTNIMRYSQDF